MFTKSIIFSDTKELLRNMLLHLTTLHLHLTTLLLLHTRLLNTPHTLANNDIQTSAIIYLSLLKIHSKFRINSRFKGKIFQFSVILYQQNIADTYFESLRTNLQMHINMYFFNANYSYCNPATFLLKLLKAVLRSLIFVLVNK